MRYICWQVLVVLVLLLSPVARSQQIEGVVPPSPPRGKLLSKPLGFAHEVKATARDFVTFRDPQWSALTIAQIGAAAADEVTTLNNLRNLHGDRSVKIFRRPAPRRAQVHFRRRHRNRRRSSRNTLFSQPRPQRKTVLESSLGAAAVLLSV
jgi:hypothetical protein